MIYPLNFFAHGAIVYLYKKISEVLFMGIKIGVVGAGFFSGDFIRLFKLHPDVE